MRERKQTPTEMTWNINRMSLDVNRHGKSHEEREPDDEQIAWRVGHWVPQLSEKYHIRCNIACRGGGALVHPTLWAKWTMPTANLPPSHAAFGRYDFWHFVSGNPFALTSYFLTFIIIYFLTWFGPALLFSQRYLRGDSFSHSTFRHWMATYRLDRLRSLLCTLETDIN